MTSEHRIHELLPWFTTGKLDPDESESFKEHLPGCAACREELETIERIKRELDDHGQALLADHPDAERLVAAVEGRLDDRLAGEVRRHLALCASCADEAKWVAGEAVARPRKPRPVGGRPATAASRSWIWPAVAAAAAVVAIVALVRPGSELPTRVLRPEIVIPVERTSDDRNVFEPGPGGRTTLAFSIDMPPGAFPVRVEVLGADGRAVFEASALGRDDVPGGTLLLDCAPSDCPPGSYVTRITASDGATRGVDLAFEIAR